VGSFWAPDAAETPPGTDPRRIASTAVIASLSFEARREGPRRQPIPGSDLPTRRPSPPAPREAAVSRRREGEPATHPALRPEAVPAGQEVGRYGKRRDHGGCATIHGIRHRSRSMLRPVTVGVLQAPQVLGNPHQWRTAVAYALKRDCRNNWTGLRAAGDILFHGNPGSQESRRKPHRYLSVPCVLRFMAFVATRKTSERW
jgi:hypothetical protein